MGRRLLLTVVAALLLAAPAAAQPRELWPGVTFDTAVQFTSNGPVALNVLTGPRPGGTTTLAPALSNETLTGTETLTAIQRRVAGSATTAGVNGDYFNFDSGAPSGILMREGQVASPPFGERSSAGITTDGTLDVRRISFFGTWQGAGAKRTLNAFNEAPPANGTALYTQAWGPTTPTLPGATALILFPLPAPVPNADLVAPVVEVRSGGGPVPIPLGGAVIVGVGSAAAVLASEGPVGQAITSRLIFKPEWPNVVSAIGGGPQIVRNGAAIFRAGETFTPIQLGARAPRTGLGQLADGRIILVAVDGRQPGYSVGMTNFELAQAMVRLGAVTAMAFDGGGSTTMAFNGTLLSKPSGPERAISTALLFEYTGVFVQPTVAVVSPDGDGVADRQSLRYKLVRPATTTVTLTAPDGVVAFTETRERQPGSFAIPFPPVARASCRARRRCDPTRERPLDAEGRRRRRSRAALRDDAGVHRQHDARLPRDRAPQALPAAGRTRPRHHVEAVSPGTRRRHGRDAGRRGRSNARPAYLPGRRACARLERPRSNEEGRQGRSVRRPCDREERARDDRALEAGPRAAHRRAAVAARLLRRAVGRVGRVRA